MSLTVPGGPGGSPAAHGRVAGQLAGCLLPVGDQRADDRLHALVRQVLRLCSGFYWRGDARSPPRGARAIPRASARMRAAWVKASVMMVTAARPRFSASIPSWRPHAVQDPQSATAWMMASHSRASWSKTSSGVGILWLIFRYVTTRDTPYRSCSSWPNAPDRRWRSVCGCR